jgi:hypothetical protein
LRDSDRIVAWPEAFASPHCSAPANASRCSHARVSPCWMAMLFSQIAEDRQVYLTAPGNTRRLTSAVEMTWRW